MLVQERARAWALRHANPASSAYDRKKSWHVRSIPVELDRTVYWRSEFSTEKHKKDAWAISCVFILCAEQRQISFIEVKPGIDVACGAILEGCCACFAFLSSPFSQEPCPSIPSATFTILGCNQAWNYVFSYPSAVPPRCTSTLVLSNHHLLFCRLRCQLDLWEAGVGFKHAQCLTFATQLKPGGPCDSSLYYSTVKGLKKFAFTRNVASHQNEMRNKRAPIH